VISEFGQGGDDEGNAAAFLVYLVEVVGVAPNTANSYLSHAIRRSVGARAIDDNCGIRTHFIKAIISLAFKLPWHFLGRRWRFVGGWEIVSRRDPSK
jgi:hypothetical protein